MPPGVRYVGVDHTLGTSAQYPGWSHGPDVVADLHDLPLPSACADTVVSLHVLEHVVSPVRVLQELRRVMKDDGRLFLAVPFLHEIHHAPHDYHRFTRHGLELALELAGLEPLEIAPTGGYHRCLHHVLSRHPTVFTRTGHRLLTLPLRAVTAFLRALIRPFEYALDLLDPHQRMVCGYVCVARKQDVA